MANTPKTGARKNLEATAEVIVEKEIYQTGNAAKIWISAGTLSKPPASIRIRAKKGPIYTH